jgi:hypothetical protein
MIERIVSGGQTGADRAGLDAAIACGILHGGWCPKGRKAEDGPIPEHYQLKETAGASYLARTERNVKQSDGTVIFTMGELTGGSLRTADFARRHGKPWIHLDLSQLDSQQATAALASFVAQYEVRVLNVAGSRGSSNPTLADKVYQVVVGCICQPRKPGEPIRLTPAQQEFARQQREAAERQRKPLPSLQELRAKTPPECRPRHPADGGPPY